MYLPGAECISIVTMNGSIERQGIYHEQSMYLRGLLLTEDFPCSNQH